MIARLGICQGIIRWATINDAPVTEFSPDEFVWEDKWRVTASSMFGVVATSSRSAKNSRINQVTYCIKPNGVAELKLRDEYRSRVLKTERVFATPGQLDGVLTLVYKQGTSHRFANFESEEFLSLRRKKGIDWVVKKSPECLSTIEDGEEFATRILGRNISANVETVNGLSKFEMYNKKYVTDGTISIDASDDRTILAVHDATFVGIYKHKINANKDQYVLVTADQTILLSENIPSKEELRNAKPHYTAPPFRTTA